MAEKVKMLAGMLYFLQKRTVIKSQNMNLE